MNTASKGVALHATPWFFLALLATGIAGFIPSYFARLHVTDFAHHAHAITAFAWMLLLVAQAWLIRMRRVVPHRALGRISFVLVPLFVVSGAAMIAAFLHSDAPFAKRFGSRLAAVDALMLGYFLFAYAQAIRHRRQMPLHARYMAATGLLIVSPALARLLPTLFAGIHSFSVAFDLSFLVVEALTVALLVLDWRRGAPLTPFATLLLALLVQHAAFHLP